MRTKFKGVIDTTFREGQQSPLLFDQYKYKFSIEDKKKIFKGLLELGVRMFEFFSPIVSKEEYEHFKILKAYAWELGYTDVLFLAHCRVVKEDVDFALKAGFNGFNFYLNLSKHSSSSYSKPLNQLVKDAVKFISTLRKAYPNLYIRFSSEDTFRADMRRVFNVYDKVYPFVNTFGMPDTVGIATPEKVAEKVRAFKQRYPKADIEVHFHNDRGLSVVNALTAVLNGASYVDTTVWGIGERSGITSVTALLLNLFLENEKFVQNYNLSVCYPLNVLFGTILGMQVPATEPVSLTNRTHIAGVHQKAVINNKQVYEAIPLARFGVNKSSFLLGPLTGSNIIYYFLKEIKGYNISFEDAKAITEEFRKTFSKYKIQDPERVLLIIADAKGFEHIEIPEKIQEKRVELL